MKRWLWPPADASDSVLRQGPLRTNGPCIGLDAAGRRTAPGILLAFVSFCFALSGFAALLYQTVWLQLFSIALGTSQLAVTITLAGYMAGLAVGAAAAARLADRTRRPLYLYGILEAAIGVFAIAMPILVTYAGDIYVWSVGNQSMPPDAGRFGQPLFYSAAGFLLLLIPTALMGATLPLLARYAVTCNANLGSRISMLYAFNTIGAAAGTVVAAFMLLPALGLRATAWTGVMVNLLVFALVVWFSRHATDQPTTPNTESVMKDEPMARVTFLLPLIALSGALSFIYEILWMRMLSHILGSSLYAFSTMLAAFLTGIALGAGFVGKLAKNPRIATMLFAASQFAIAIASAFIYSRLEVSIPSSGGEAIVAFAIILPATLFIGATYPLAVRGTAGEVDRVGRASAAVYSWNTVGAIVGAVAGSFYIIPELGFSGTARFVVVGNLLIGCSTIVLAMRVPTWRPIDRRLCAIGVSIAILTVAVFRPGIPYGLISRPLFGEGDTSEINQQYYAVGRSSTVYLAETSTGFALRTNGLPEAELDFRGAPPKANSQRWLGLWPGIFRAGTDSMLVIGLGGGVLLEGVADSVHEIHVIELEAEVVEANSIVAQRRNINPLSDPRLHIVINDARNGLRLTNRRYDAIVSQPSHPWAAGAAPLFTREFFSLARSRLTEGGVLVQWMNAEFLDQTLFRRLAATVLAEFRYVRIYQPSALVFHFIASNEPLEMTSGTAQSALLFPSMEMTHAGIASHMDVVGTLFLDESGVRQLAKGSMPITDNDNRMAVASNYLGTGLSAKVLHEVTASFDPLLDKNGPLRRSVSDKELILIGSHLIRSGQVKRMTSFIDTVERQSSRQLLKAILLKRMGVKDNAVSVLRDVPPASPLYEEAVFLSIVDSLPWVASGDISFDNLPRIDPESPLGRLVSGWQLMAKQEWEGIMTLDGRLSEISPSDLWAPYAVQLRVEWRLNANDPSGQLASEALWLLERTLAANPTLDGFTQRARAGLILGDIYVFIESAAHAVRTARNIALLELEDKSPSEATIRAILRRLYFFDRELHDFLDVDSTGRVVIVASEVRRAIREIEDFVEKRLPYTAGSS